MKPLPPFVAMAASALALTACTALVSVSGAKQAIPLVRVTAESDLDCPQDNIQIQEQPGGRFLVTGCGKKAIYQAACDGLDCKVRSPGDRSIPTHDRPDPGSPLLP